MDQLFHTYLHSPIGYIYICSTETEITRLSFLDNAEIHHQKNKYIPTILNQAVLQLVEYFDGKRKSFDLQLAQNGTPFQKNVWETLGTIPYGKTINYLALATKTGDAKASRAVANANSKNEILIFIPCHRVIGSSGELTGYAGGIWRKKWLLELEAKYKFGVQPLF
jgi:methylated-DNA-[protein]-cysteine S-methyltransferase